MARRLLLLLTSVAIVLALGRGARTALRHWFGPPDVITDAAQYATVLKAAPAHLVAHFPSVIPAGATDVRFRAYAGFLQGMPWAQLHVRLAAGEVRRIDEQSARTAIFTVPGVTRRGKHGRRPTTAAWMPIPPYYASPTTDTSFLDDFAIYVFRADDYGSGSWDPSDVIGVAVSRRRDEVVYFADYH